MTGRDRVVALGEIVRSLSRGDSPEEVVRVALESVQKTIGADVVSFATPEANRVRFTILDRDVHTVTTFPHQEGGLTESILKSGEVRRVDDLTESRLPTRRRG